MLQQKVILIFGLGLDFVGKDTAIKTSGWANGRRHDMHSLHQLEEPVTAVSRTMDVALSPEPPPPISLQVETSR